MMESKFIELHTVNRANSDRYESPLSVNIHHVIDFENHAITDSTGKRYNVGESYDEIKQLIRDTGTLIHRADPRLDETHRLTMADLKEMIGEPVWNSNTGKWTLVRNYIEALEPDGIDVAFLLDAADNSAGMTAGDLIRFPLYRMRRGDHERGKGSMTEEEAEVIREEIVKSAELRQKLGTPPVEGM